MADPKTYCRKDSVVCRRIAGEFILVPIRGDLANMQAIFALNPVGHSIWESLGERMTVAQMRHVVTDRFDVDEEQAGKDVDEFLADLEAAELVTGRE